MHVKPQSSSKFYGRGFISNMNQARRQNREESRK